MIQVKPTKKISITMQASEWRVLAAQLLMLQNTVPDMANNETTNSVMRAIKESGVLDGKMKQQMLLLKDAKYKI